MTHRAHDPVGDRARTELDRLAHRWHSLPVGQARLAAVPVRDLAAELLDVPVDALPDLGPAAALDQLRVAVHEAATGTHATDADPAEADADLAERLAELRRTVTATLTR